MFGVLSTESFYNLWYWALTVYVWTLVCHRTLGVPYDMILRAERLPEVADEVDCLARISIGRIAAAAGGGGMPAAATAGFALATLATLGFGLSSEIAQAAFMLLAPLAVVGLATVRLALRLARAHTNGPELRRLLARRRLWNQVIAFAAMIAAAAVALGHYPRLSIG